MSWTLAVSMQVAVAAGGAPDASGVTFDEALGFARQGPLVVAGARAAAVAGEMGERVSSMASNPQVTVQPGARLLPLSGAGPELTIGVSQSWNLSGLGGARKESLKAERETLSAEARAAALSLRLSAAKKWLDLWTAQKIVGVAAAEADVARDLAKLSDKAAAAQAATRADTAEARAYLAEAKLAVIDAEGEVFERGLDLSREIASRRAEAVSAAGELPEPGLPERGTWATALKKVELLPSVQAKALALRAEEARAAEESAARGTWLTAGVLVTKDAPDGLTAFGTLGLTVPLFDRGERERAPMAARAARLAGEKASAAIEARTEMALAFHEVEHTAEVLAAVKEGLLPALVEAAAAREQLFRAGDGTMVDVLTARRRVLSAKARLLRARGMNAWAKVKVWMMLAELASADGGERARKEAP